MVELLTLGLSILALIGLDFLVSWLLHIDDPPGHRVNHENKSKPTTPPPLKWKRK